MIRPAGVFLFVALLWSWGASVVGSPLILPGPGDVLIRLLALQTPDLWVDALRSAARVLTALTSVLILGVSSGLFLGLNPELYAGFRPLLLALQAIPVVSWLGLLIFTLGIGWRAPVLITILVFLPPAVFTTISGLKSLSPELLELAQFYSVPNLRRWRDLYLGALKPCIGAVVDTVAGGAWKTILVAEYLCGGNGLGVRLAWARQTVDVEGVYALTLFALILGLTGECLLRRLSASIRRRWTSCSG